MGAHVIHIGRSGPRVDRRRAPLGATIDLRGLTALIYPRGMEDEPERDLGGPVSGADLRAALATHGPPDADRAAFAEAVPADARFASLEEVARACPPERAGLRPGAFTAVLGPLFGEFE